MLDNPAIDVALGLIFIFLLYSLLASIIQEIIARVMGLRARTLLKSVRRMLEDGREPSQFTFCNFFKDAGESIANYFVPIRAGNTFLKAFYEYPTIKYLGESHTSSKPSYISSSNFANTVIVLLLGQGYNPSLNQMQVLRGNLVTGKIDGFSVKPQTLRALNRMWVQSQNDIERFRRQLENWYDETMMRTTGWYKKQTQWLLFIIGFILACGFNVDPIAISKILAKNDTARKAMVDMAMNKQKKIGALIQSQKDIEVVDSATKKTVTMRYITLGDDELMQLVDSMKFDAKLTQQILGLGDREKMDTKIRDTYQKDLTTARVGWLLTAFSISLGAAFWFDLLNKVMLLRNAGARPESSDDAKSKSNNPPPVKPVG